MQAIAQEQKPAHQSQLTPAAGPAPAQHPRAASPRAPLHHPLMVQAKLTMGAPGDAFEAEADRVSDHVMSSAHPAVIQRQVAEPLAQLSAPAAAPTGAVAATELASRAVERAGTPLPGDARAFFEPRMGQSFSDVRVHADAEAAAGASSVQAHAYTVGRDIVFAAGQYAPATDTGKRLLAHELTHVVQQRGGSTPTVQRKLAVSPGLSMDTKGFTTSKASNVYTCPAITKTSVWNEIFSSLLFSPRVFTVFGKTNAEVDDNVQKHMAARFNIVDFASKKKYSFGAGAAFKMNPAFWIVDATGFKPQPGKTRMEAIQDLNVHPKDYAIACLAATQLTMESGASPLTNDLSVAPDDWIPGDWGYILNTKFPPGGTVGLEGENIIYTGKDKFWGHFGPGIEYKLLTEWFDEVKAWHGGALTRTHRTRPTIGIVP